jgi:hypothetical protein
VPVDDVEEINRGNADEDFEEIDFEDVGTGVGELIK